MNNELVHHGRQGQKWGVRNGPPYPLSRQGITRKEYNKTSSKNVGNKSADKYGGIRGDGTSIRKGLERVSKITKKMDRNAGKLNSLSKKYNTEAEKKFFKNPNKLQKISEKITKINRKQENLILEGKKEYEKIKRDLNDVTIDEAINAAKAVREAQGLPSNSLDKMRSDFERIKESVRDYDLRTTGITKIDPDRPGSEYDEILKKMMEKGTTNLSQKEIVEASMKSNDPSRSMSDLDISYQDAKEQFEVMRRELSSDPKKLSSSDFDGDKAFKLPESYSKAQKDYDKAHPITDFGITKARSNNSEKQDKYKMYAKQMVYENNNWLEIKNDKELKEVENLMNTSDNLKDFETRLYDWAKKKGRSY